MKIIKTNNITDCIEQACLEAKKYNSLDGPSCHVFSDDQITLSIELKLAEMLGGFLANISTFRHYIQKSKENIKVLSKEVACMVIRRIITETDGFTCYKNIKNSPNLAGTIFDLISQIESANITPSRLKEIIEDDSNDLPELLRKKLHDILLVYEKYCDYLNSSGKFDSVGYLNLLPDLIKEDKQIKDEVVIFVGFSTMTKIRLEAIKAFDKYAKEVICVVICDNSKIYTNETLNKLTKAFNASSIDTQSTMIEESKILKDNLYEPRIFAKSFVPYKTNKVIINEARNKEDEVKILAENIIKDVKAGKRFNNIAIACGNLDSYRLKIKETFRKYNIPYYMDEPLKVSYHPICALIENYIDMIRKGLDRESVIKFIKNPLFSTNLEAVDKFITYINKKSISRKGFAESFENQELEQIRSQVHGIYLQGKDCKKVKENIIAINTMLEMLNVEEKINSISKKLDQEEMDLVDFNSRIFEAVKEFLNSIVEILGETNIPLIEIKNLIKTGLNAMELENIPFLKDSVFIGECKDIKMKTTRCLYAIGINGEIPFVSSDSCILTDSDLAHLDSFQIEIEPKIEAVNKRERENVCLTFMSFKEKLTISYSATSDGSGGVVSEIIKYIARIFNLTINKNIHIDKYINCDAIINRISELLSLKNDKFSYVSKDEIDSEIEDIKEQINKLVEEQVGTKNLLEKIECVINSSEDKKEIVEGVRDLIKDFEISTTMIEKYQKCPYSNYAQNLLCLKQDEDGELKLNNFGSIYHELVENYVKGMKLNVSDKVSSDIFVEKIIEEIFNKKEYSSYINNNKYNYVRALITNEGKRFCFNIYDNMVKTKFEPWLFEEEFSDDVNSKFKAIKLNTKFGVYKVNGKVDRVDKCNINGQDYIRIIDYKSGKLHASDEEFYTGRYLQLYLYMTAFVDENRKAAGGYYFPIRDSYEREDDAAKNNTYRMDGNTLKDDDVIAASDNTLDEKISSTLIHLKRNVNDKKTGEINYDKRISKLLDEEEYNGYLGYAKKIAEKGAGEIVEGHIKPSPYDGECEYCLYCGMCGHYHKIDGRRKEKDIEKELIVVPGNK